MIVLDSICKRYRTKTGWNNVLRNVNGTFEDGVNTGVIGRGGVGKSTLFRILSGAQLADSGKITRTGRISWPLGFSGGVHPDLDARANIRFICRIYGVDYKKVYSFIEEFTELGEYLDMPIHTYSSGMRAKLAFGLSMAIGFEWYLIDEITAVGDAAFKKKCKAEFKKRKKESTLLVVSHSMQTIRQHCERVAVLEKGQLIFFDDLEEGAEYYNNLGLAQQRNT